MFVKTRQEMAQYINDRMNKTYYELREEQQLEYESSLTKAYLVEAHLLGDVSHDEILAFLKKAFTRIQTAKKYKVTIKETEEENFFNAQIKEDNEPLIFYVDASDSRFWLIHSMDKSVSVDPLIDKLTSWNQNLDRAWLPIQLLEEISKLGDLRGLGLDYDRREIPDVNFEIPEAPVEFLKMQLWGNKAGKVLQILREKDAFPHETTLSKVKVKFWIDGESTSEFSLDDIKYDGKITARGTSFQSHVTLVTNLYQKYSDKIRELEKHYALSYKEEGERFSISGMPINIIFPAPIKNLDLFCESVFSSTKPFRLWGIPIKLNENYVRISGFDLHVGKRISFEITPEFMRLYLPEGSCANSVVRIFTNLQHYYDSLIEAKNGDGESIFSF